jgi:hypothetical protein
VSRINRQVRLRAGKTSLLLATFASDGVWVNSSMDFNLVNELRRFLDAAKDPEELALQITEGEKVLEDRYPEPDGLDVSDAADLIEARSRVQCSLDLMMAGVLPNWLGQDEAKSVKSTLVKLISDYTREINLKLEKKNDAIRDVRTQG